LITREEVLKIAKLAKLSFNEDEIEALTRDMIEIINFADTINTLVKDEEIEDFDDINKIENAFHEDVVHESLDRELILKNAEGGDNGYFLVKRRNSK